MSNPLDEYFMEKAALFGMKPETSKRVGEVARDTAIQAGVVAGMSMVVPVGQKILDAVSKRHDYNQMLKQNPDLSDLREDAPEMFDNAYTSLRRMNPEFARDPIVAGSFMRQIGGNPESAGRVIVESLKARKGLTFPFQNALNTGVAAGQRTFTGGFPNAMYPPEEDPFAEQAQRVRGLDLSVKEREQQAKMDAFAERDRQHRMF